MTGPATGDAPGDLELRGVRKSFGRTVGVSELDLKLTRGELVALLGPSGCGKTTTLRIVAGFEQPDRGEVWLRGTPATTLPPYRRDVGIVFQNYALFPHMTVFENVAYGLRRRHVPASELGRRVAEALAMVHLDTLAERYPRQLSGGQQQRVAVARAVVIRPSILLFDEPLSNLDAKLRQAMRGELRNLQQQLGITALFVTHDQEEALALADRIAVMNAGVVEQIGTAEQVYRRPRTRFVATFVGECNFLAGRLDEGDRFEVAGIAVAIADAATVPAGAATLALRPEDIRILPPDREAANGSQTLEGRVGEVVYLGGTYRYRVALANGAELLVVRQRDGAIPFGRGDPVRLAWQAADAMLFPGSV
jgi:putative spermidine/putrescine transport system ATP-binding protein